MRIPGLKKFQCSLCFSSASLLPLLIQLLDRRLNFDLEYFCSRARLTGSTLNSSLFSLPRSQSQLQSYPTDYQLYAVFRLTVSVKLYSKCFQESQQKQLLYTDCNVQSDSSNRPIRSSPTLFLSRFLLLLSR